MLNYDMRYLGPPGPDDNVYGLYEPIDDLFLAVGKDIATMHELAFLFSSRYIVYVCHISAAKNYADAAIDNITCSNWTMSNKRDFSITRFPNLYQVLTAAELVKSPGPKPWNLNNDQEYLKVAYHYLTEIIPCLERRAAYANILHQPHMLSDTSAMVKQRIETLPGAPIPDLYIDTIAKIRQIIYTEFDVTKAIPLLTDIEQSIPHLYA